MEEGTFEVILGGLRRIFPRGKGKELCPHWKEKPEAGRSITVSGTLRTMEGITHDIKARNVMLSEGLVQGGSDVSGEEEEGWRASFLF